MAPRNKQQGYGTSLQHEPDFNGPRGKRSCTDVLCLLLFIIALAVWGFIGRYAYVYGDPYKLIVPADSNGRRCGQDSEVVHKPNLLFFDLTQCATTNVLLDGCTTPQICRESCPEKAWSAYMYINNPEFFNVADVKNNLICKTDSDVDTVTNVNILKSYVESGRCAPWQLPSSPVYGRCLPNIDAVKAATDVLKSINSSVDAIKHATEVVQKLSTVNEVSERVVEDLMHTWRYLVIGLFLAMFICLIYITMLRWIAGLMIWLSLIAIIVLLGWGVYASFVRYRAINPVVEEPTVPPGRQTLRTRINDFFQKKSTWLWLSIISSVLFIIVFLVLVFLRERINIAITLIKEGSKAVGSVISALFFPVFPWLFQLGVVVYFICIGVSLWSIGHNTFKVYGVENNTNCVCEGNYYKDKDICTVADFNNYCKNPEAQGSDRTCLKAGCYFVALESDNLITYLQFYNLFAMFWGVWFFSGLAEMILAATFATWYWTFHKRNLPFFTLTASIYTSIRYHMGTVAFGSLIIAICSFIRAILEFIEIKLKRYNNAFTKAILCLLKCCFWCLHKFICFINTNAYIMCAIHGKNFCSSAQEAFFLLMRNVIRVVVVDKVTDFLLFLGKVVITATIMVGSYYVFRGPVRLLDNTGRDVVLNYTFIVPAVALGIGTYLISSIFFRVYAMAVDTLFLCFLEDCERNDGSPEKPYFMSKKLMKILGKKNKKP